ncbi:SWI/SNF and RSC complex subunit Ssr3 [Mycoemilia scoparia]|uniref:SWI/SNF and RSC complex subunit Ssr3 n=1 Tax=Mycoemilia scoparia TaxID=417184 RepID=A0A9W7ZZV0_9FUNG|nr:SWI/SNF and RSC complex subunit Ssr3 [Mycoemilia scoparia]
MPRRKRTLRVFVSNLAANQNRPLTKTTNATNKGGNTTEKEDMAVETGDETKKGENEDPTAGEEININDDEIPSWTLKIEGRLIDPPGTTWKNRPAPRKFTEFIKSMVVEFDRDPNQYKDNTVNWVNPAINPANLTNTAAAAGGGGGTFEQQDGFEIKRMGDQNVKAKIILQLKSPVEKYEISSPKLRELLNIEAGQTVTRATVIRSLWHYIKKNDLQDSNNPELVKCDSNLKSVFGGAPNISFTRIPELLRQFYAPPRPVVIDYEIRVDSGTAVHRPQFAYDIQVEAEEPFKHKLGPLGSLQVQQREVSHLDEQIGQLLQNIHNSRQKRDFLRKFSQDPAGCINQWIDSQAKDLETLLGSRRDGFEAAAGSLGVGLTSTASKTKLYSEPWVEEALYHYLYAKSQDRLFDKGANNAAGTGVNTPGGRQL